MFIEFLIDGATITVPASTLQPWRPLPTPAVPATLDPRPVRPYYRVRGIKNRLVQPKLDSLHAPDGFILDETPGNILEFIWNPNHDEIIIKAEYPGLPVYRKKFPFDRIFQALALWTNLTFLFYLRLEERGDRRSGELARQHRGGALEVLRGFRFDEIRNRMRRTDAM
jgi:hypothetical protein